VTGTLRRLGVRDDVVALDLVRSRAVGLVEAAEREIATVQARAHAEARSELAAWVIAARVAYAQALEVEESTVIALACDVARAVLGREATSGSEVLRDVTQAALERVRRAKRVALRVHPDDLSKAQREARGWFPDGGDGVDFGVLADVAVERGGVIVESELGRIDARLDVQCAEVARILDGSRRVV
jgi:type III secretion protein L